MSKIVDVAAAVLLRENGNGCSYLLAQRPVGKVYAGYWEFPGGKVEPGETLHAALVREIQEELGVTIEHAWPWLTRRFVYPHASVRLKFFRVTAWHGEIAPIEHSGFTWVRLGDEPEVTPVLPANGPILRALALPATYAVSNATENGIAGELQRLRQALAGGLRLIQIRDKALPAAQRLELAQGVMSAAREHVGSCVLVNDDADLAHRIGADGLHLSAARLAATTQRPDFEWLAASCHDAAELARAAELGCDFAVLGPTLPTATHPGAAGLGWEEFARLADALPLPVYALGGMTHALLDTARVHGAHGVAMLRGW